jgi:hypothetical protein
MQGRRFEDLDGAVLLFDPEEDLRAAKNGEALLAAASGALSF